MSIALQSKFKFNILEIDVNEINDPNASFAEKAKRNYIFRYGNRLKWFKDQVKILADGSDPKQLGEFEAAKRLNIGTITGKHH